MGTVLVKRNGEVIHRIFESVFARSKKDAVFGAQVRNVSFPGLGDLLFSIGHAMGNPKDDQIYIHDRTAYWAIGQTIRKHYVGDGISIEHLERRPRRTGPNQRPSRSTPR